MSKRKSRNTLKVPRTNIPISPIRGQSKIKLKASIEKEEESSRKNSLDMESVVSPVQESIPVEHLTTTDPFSEDGTLGEGSVGTEDPVGSKDSRRGSREEPAVDPLAQAVKDDPRRDCTKFNIKARAAALFDALDADGSGEIDDQEFIEGILNVSVFCTTVFSGCMKDEEFVALLKAFDGDKIWGEVGLG